MAVYPAAGLIYYKPGIPIYYIDPKANETPNVSKNTIRIAEKASIGVAQLVNELEKS